MSFLDYVKHTGKDHVSPRGFKVGQRVVIPEMTVDDEVVPREVGVVVSVPEQKGRVNDNMIVVEVDLIFRNYEEGYDDGLREVGDDQVEIELEPKTELASFEEHLGILVQVCLSRQVDKADVAEALRRQISILEPNFLDFIKYTGEYSEDHVSPRGFKVGQRVVLPELDNGSEVGKVVFVPPQDSGDINRNLIVVEVDEAYRKDGDDGLREVGDEQVEIELGP